MTAWVFILTPFVVLPIVLLFRFIGCSEFGEGSAAEPAKPAILGYRDTIMAETSVIAYWRLVDDAGSGTKAEDQKHFQDGEYIDGVGLPPEDNPPFDPASEAATGGFLPSQQGLIQSDPAKCRFFNGGHVRVPFKQGLYRDEFTIEAWIHKGWQQKSVFEHVLFSAGGHYRAPLADSKRNHGFMVLANGQGRWEAQFFTDDGVVSLPLMPLPTVPGEDRPTHIALIVKNNDDSSRPKLWYIYSDGKEIGPGSVKSYSPPDGAPLFIGVGGRNNDPNDPNPTPRFPILSHIQEVVLHNRALSQEEIQNHVNLNV